MVEHMIVLLACKELLLILSFQIRNFYHPFAAVLKQGIRQKIIQNN
jgi:hypothetical protein